MAAAARFEEFNPLDMVSVGLRIIGMEFLSVIVVVQVMVSYRYLALLGKANDVC